MGQPPSGTVTFLFTDIEGSTRLWEDHPDAMRSVLARHDELVGGAVAAHAGHVVKTTGDGFHVAFATAADALGAAIDAQATLAAEPWGEIGSLRVRMGVHTGEAQERDGDYFGSSVNRAARVMAVAHGGQVVCSRATMEVAGSSFALRSLGDHRLRDLAAAQELFQVGDGTFPPLRSVDVVPTNLPTVRTELIGRTDELTSLMELVERERLVTLTGVGGVGKTRLALGVAAALAAGFADGCWLVELSPVADGHEVLKTVAAAIHAPTTTLDALVDYLADRRVLIVLDNCEHVLDAAADLVDALLEVAPDVHVVVTSREPLGLDGEQVRRVQSLALPTEDAAPDAAQAAAAVRLFVERAVAVRAGFTVDAGNVAAVVEVCRHLDGIPLAIELAAARVAAMAPADIARRLGERFRLLAGGSRRAQERHRTLLATVAWSHDLLTDDEKLIFRRLTVFPATFDLAAAEAVAGGEAVDVIDCVLRLVNRSLVVFEPDHDRYRLLETLRQYGADRLADAGETEAIRERHAQYFLAFAERLEPELLDERYTSAYRAVAADLDNLRAAADWLIQTERWAELSGLCHGLWFFVIQSAPVDGAAWYRAVVDHGEQLGDQIRIDRIGELAWLEAMSLGNFAAGTRLAEQSCAHADAADLAVSPWAWMASSIAQVMSGRNAEGLHSADLGFAAAAARDDGYSVIVALCNQSGALAALGERERAIEVAEDAIRRADGSGHPLLISAAVVAAAGTHLQINPPDFAGSFAILERHAVGLNGGGDLNDMWLDVQWGVTLLGLDRPAAVRRIARAARRADRLDSAHVLDHELRQLAIAAAEGGLIEQALALVSYTEAKLRDFRIDNPAQGWIQGRLDRALDRRVGRAPEPPSRREVMALVSEIETALTTAQPGARPVPG